MQENPLSFMIFSPHSFTFLSFTATASSQEHKNINSKCLKQYIQKGRDNGERGDGMVSGAATKLQMDNISNNIKNGDKIIPLPQQKT